MKDGTYLNVFKCLLEWKNINLYGYRNMDLSTKSSENVYGAGSMPAGVLSTFYIPV